MKFAKYILVLLFWNMNWVAAQSSDFGHPDEKETYVFDEEWDEDDDDIDFDLENEWSLSDTLNKQYKSRKFRDNWRESYRGNLFDYTEKISERNNSSFNWDLSGLFHFLAVLGQILGYGVIALVVFLVIRALLTDSGISLQGFRKKQAPYSVVNDGELNIEEDWLAKATEAKIRGDLKTAVRFYFLAYLKQLNQEEHIDFHKDKSNREYRYEIIDNSVRNEFDVLSRVFDYCWYGDFEINAAQFSQVEILFSKHLKR